MTVHLDASSDPALGAQALQVATRAAAVVAAHYRIRRLPDVHLVVGGARDVERAERAAVQAVVPEARRSRIREARERWSMARGILRMHCVAGTTTLHPRGVLVALYAPTVAADTELRVVLAHEMVHVAQLSRPGRRSEHIQRLRVMTGAQRLPQPDIDALCEAMDRDEDEAYGLEDHLAAQLR